MPENILLLTKKQTSIRVAAKTSIVEMLTIELAKEQKELAALQARPHDTDIPKPRDEGILDYKKMSIPTLHDRKRVLMQQLARTNGKISELKVKIVAIDNIIISKIKNS